MKKLLISNQKKIKRVFLFFIATCIVLLSVVSWYISYIHQLTVLYNDAMSHLNISRLLVDNMQPGLSQLGGVWLPLNHVLPLIFIWNDWAWHSGFAGSIFSMIAYIFSVLGIYKIVKTITQNTFASLIGSLTFAFNLNILYLQTTPLTEPLYLMFFIFSALSFIKWMKEEKVEYLMLIGVFGFLQVVTRYDGWFVCGISLLLLFYYELVIKKDSFKSILGKLTLAGFPIFFGISLWLLWNLLIFGSPLFFAIGPYSAHAQQAAIQAKTGLITKHNLYYSYLSYGYAVLDNIGIFITFLSTYGLFSYVTLKNKLFNINKRILITLFLALPIIFNVLSLFMGFSILNLPELKWNPSPDPTGQWFNVRYGILALPFITVFVGILSSYKKSLTLFIIIIILLQTYLIYKSGIITIIDGIQGSSSFVNNDVAKKLHQLVKADDTLLISTSYFSAVDFKSGVHMSQIIHEGVSSKWPYALFSPEKYATWIVMSKSNVGDQVYISLVEKQKNKFLNYYQLAYTGKNASIYRLKDQNVFFITRDGNQLEQGANSFTINGINSYNLSYKTDQEITDTFISLHSIGVNTIRFWAFGDGTSDGFQTQAGIINEERFAKMDYIISSAKFYHIKVIPVLSNNWNDYGGKEQYLKWLGKDTQNTDVFYTDQDSINLYKNYISKVITRNNSITKIKYSEDPSILAWDIMNEPRITQLPNKDSITNWTNTVTTYIKDIDHNHLVTVGTERAVSDNNSNEASEVCKLPIIDFCSIHLYLYDKEKPLFNSYGQIDQFLIKQTTYARTVAKPIIVEEFGVSKTTHPFEKNPQNVMKDIVSLIKKRGFNGYLIWNWSETSDSSFGFSPFGNQDKQYSLSDLKTIISN